MDIHTEVEACRTCGIFFLTSSNLLRYLFSNEPEMVHVRRELESWKIQLNENSNFSNFICTVCLLEFHRIFKFQSSCLETQEQFEQFYNLQQQNIQNIKIKTELCENSIAEDVPIIKKQPEPVTEQNVCAFIYVDDLSDGEYENDNGNCATPFKVPHLPLKQEIIEEAHVPLSELSEEKCLPTPDLSVLTLMKEPDATVQSNFKAQNEPNANIQCELCLHVSTDQQQHRQHLLRVHETKPVECHICGKQFKAGTTATRLKYHLKWHRINKHVKCAQCGFHCASRDMLNDHMKAVHTKLACKICGKVFLPKRMRQHMEKHRLSGEQEKFPCSFCLIDFTSDNERNQHILMQHERECVNANDVVEQFAATTFSDNTQTDFHPAEEDAQSPSCSGSTTSTTLDSLSPSEERHIGVELEEKEENETASFDENFTNENNEIFDEIEEQIEYNGEDAEDELQLSSFSQSMPAEMEFSCAQCPQTFVKVEQLIAHSETHRKSLPKKPFECEICGKGFDLKFSLNRHLKKH